MSDPKGALEHAEGLTSEHRHGAINLVLSLWTKHAPAAAWEWARLKDPENAPHIHAVLSELAKSDGAMAWAFAGDFAREHPHTAEYAHTAALMGIMHEGRYEEAAGLIGRVDLPGSPDGLSGQYQLADALAGHWARFEPENAAAWVESWPESIAKRHALIQVGQAWSETDPQGAARFALRLPAGDIRKMAVTQTVTSWLANEPAEASAWLDQQEPSPDFDDAVYALATTPHVGRNPDVAISWADSITNSELRLQALHAIITDWAKRDPGAALEYLQGSTDLPEETRVRLLADID